MISPFTRRTTIEREYTPKLSHFLPVAARVHGRGIFRIHIALNKRRNERRLSTPRKIEDTFLFCVRAAPHSDLFHSNARSLHGEVRINLVISHARTRYFLTKSVPEGIRAVVCAAPSNRGRKERVKNFRRSQIQCLSTLSIYRSGADFFEMRAMKKSIRGAERRKKDTYVRT